MGKISSGENFLFFQIPATEEPKIKKSFIVLMNFRDNCFESRVFIEN